MLLFSASSSPPAGYQGPGDQASGADGFWGLRGYDGAYAAGSNKAINVRRASDNTTQDINILSDGTLDIASANAFAGIDATGAGSISGTTLIFTGGHIGDTITGGTVAAGTYIVSGSSPTWTVNISQTVSSATLSLQWGLYVTELYDQSGNGVHLTQSTNAQQAQLLPNAINGLPALNFVGSASQGYSGTLGGAVAQPWSVSAVTERTGSTASFTVCLGGSASSALGWTNAANTAFVASSGGSNVTGSATDDVAHSIQGVVSGASSIIVIDGSASGTQVGGVTAFQTAVTLGYLNGGSYMTGLFATAGLWPLAFDATQYGDLRSNDSGFYATP